MSLRTKWRRWRTARLIRRRLRASPRREIRTVINLAQGLVDAALALHDAHSRPRPERVRCLNEQYRVVFAFKTALHVLNYQQTKIARKRIEVIWDEGDAA